MTEIIRYSQIGKEDCRFGLGTFEVRLADGRVVTLSEIDVGALLTNAALSTQILTLVRLTLTDLEVNNAVTLNTATIAGLVDLTTGQVKFPATQNASSDVNTLDDYEEGTWTPNVGGTATYTTQDGSYVKFGKVVFIRGTLVINVLGTGSNAAISGLPFVSGAGSSITVGAFLTLALSVVYLSGRILSGQSVIFLESLTAAGTTVGTNPVLGNGSQIEFAGCYLAAN